MVRLSIFTYKYPAGQLNKNALSQDPRLHHSNCLQSQNMQSTLYTWIFTSSSPKSTLLLIVSDAPVLVRAFRVHDIVYRFI